MKILPNFVLLREEKPEETSPSNILFEMLFLNMAIRSLEIETHSDKSLLLTGLRELSKGRGQHGDKVPVAANKSMVKPSQQCLSHQSWK